MPLIPIAWNYKSRRSLSNQRSWTTDRQFPSPPQQVFPEAFAGAALLEADNIHWRKKTAENLYNVTHLTTLSYHTPFHTNISIKN